MTYRSYSNHRDHREFNIPFSDFTAPMSYVGEAVYTAVESATRFIGQAFEGGKIRARERATISELRALDDRTLKDIGISRSDIRDIARILAEKPGVDPRLMRM